MKTKLTKAQKAHLKLSQKVMQTAWEISRRAAAKFGRKASDYIICAIRLVWKSYKPEQFWLFT